MMFECRKGCTVSDKYGRCPRCGEFMLSHGNKTYDEVVATVLERQNAHAGDLAGDNRRMDNSHIRAVKKHALDAENNYFKNLNANR